MSRKVLRTSLVTSLACISIISVSSGLASCQEEVSCYEIKNDHPLFGHHSGQGNEPLCLYKDRLQYQGKVAWSVVNDQNGKIRIDEKTHKLVWDDLDAGQHLVKVAAFVDNNKKVAENEIKLNICDEAIFGKTQLEAQYDQEGNSGQKYLLINESGLIQNAEWSLEDDITNGRIRFQGDMIVWSADLDVKQYQFKIVAKSNGKVWKTGASLTVKKSYTIDGHLSHAVDKTGKGKSNAYRLLQDARPTKHKNYSWGVECRDDDIKVSVDDNGIITWDNIKSSTVFVLIAKNRNTERQLATLRISLSVIDVKKTEYSIRNKQQDQTSNNITGYLTRSGSVDLAFCEEDAIYTKEVNWTIQCFNDDAKGITIDQKTGRITWSDKLVAKSYILIVRASIANDSNKRARNIYILDIINPYHFSFEKDSFMCSAAKEGATNTTFVLETDSTNVPSDIKYSVESKATDVFSYTNDHKIHWNNKIENGLYCVKLIATKGDVDCASMWVTIRAINSRISGSGLIQTNPNQEFTFQYALIFLGKKINGGVNWSLSDNFNGKITIDQNGKLTGKVDTSYKLTIIAKYKDEEIRLSVIISVDTNYDILYHGKVFECCADGGSYKTPFALTDGAGQIVPADNVVWRKNGGPDWLQISNDGTLTWKEDGPKKNEIYSVIVQACAADSQEKVYAFTNINLCLHISDFATASWAEIAQTAQKGLSAIKKHFGFKDDKEIIGLTKKLTLNKKDYDARIVSINHDDKENDSKAPLTFEIVQYISDEEGNGIANNEWVSDGTYRINNYKVSNVRKQAQIYSEKIEDENNFQITTVNKKTARAFYEAFGDFDNELEITQEKCYLASGWELIPNFSGNFPDREEPLFDYYKDKTELKYFQKKDINGNKDEFGYWLRTASTWRVNRKDAAKIARVWPDGSFESHYMNNRGHLSLFFSL